MSDQGEDFDRRVEHFLARVDFARLETITGIDGVSADWDELRTALGETFSDLRPLPPEIDLLDAGLVGAHWDWRRGERSVSVSLAVSSAGFAPVHQKLLSSATETTMLRIPYGPGPGKLGDLALRHKVDDSDLVMWVYRNIFVLIDGDGRDLDLEPVAQSIQRFAESHRVRRIAEHLPAVDRLETSAREIHVGDDWRVSIALGKRASSQSTLVEFDQDGARDGVCRLEPLGASKLAASYRAVSPGTARVQIRVVDQRTLLSPALSATVEILPAR